MTRVAVAYDPGVKVMRAVGFFLVLTLGLAVLATVAGLVAAAFADRSVVETIAWALIIGGALIVLLTGLSGSTARNYAEGRPAMNVVLGGRLAGVSLPQTPLSFMLVGAALIALGAVVSLYA